MKHQLKSQDELKENIIGWVDKQFEHNPRGQETSEQLLLWLFASMEAEMWEEAMDRKDYINFILTGITPMSLGKVDAIIEGFWQTYVDVNDYDVILNFLNLINSQFK